MTVTVMEMTTIPASSSSGKRRGPARIVALVDHMPDDGGVLDAAIHQAVRHQAPLLVLSHRQSHAVRCAAYSFATEVGRWSGKLRPVDSGYVARHHARCLADMRRRVRAAAKRAGIRWQLLEIDGRLVDEVLALNRPDDLLMLTRILSAPERAAEWRRAALALARRAAGAVQMVQPASAVDRGRVAVLLDDEHSAARLLETAAGRARLSGRRLVALLTPQARHSAAIADLLQQCGIRCRVRAVAAKTAAELLPALAEEHAAELVIGRAGPWLDSPAAGRVLALWQLPVFIAAR